MFSLYEGMYVQTAIGCFLLLYYVERERERSRERKRERAKEGERDREGDKEREGGEDSLREGERETAIKRESPTKRGGVKIKKSQLFCSFPHICLSY